MKEIDEGLIDLTMEIIHSALVNCHTDSTGVTHNYPEHKLTIVVTHNLLSIVLKEVV